MLYEGLFLRAVSEFEAFLEARFFEVVSGRMRGGKNRLAAKVETKAVSTIRAIILGGEDYIKWLPYKEALAHAERFLVGGRPFSLLDDGEKSQLAQVTWTRNAIAHSSEFARQQFLKKVVGSANVLPREKKPAGFLRSVVRASPTMTRYEAYASNLIRIALKLR